MQPSTSTSPPVARPSAVLVVDDDEGTRLVIARMLKEQGMTVFTAASGTAALARLATDGATIGTVVTDVTMPDMTGVELTYQIRERYPLIGIAIVSGDISDIERSVVARAGVPFLKKPVRLDALLGAVRDARRTLGPEYGQEASARL